MDRITRGCSGSPSGFRARTNHRPERVLAAGIWLAILAENEDDEAEAREDDPEDGERRDGGRRGRGRR